MLQYYPLLLPNLLYAFGLYADIVVPVHVEQKLGNNYRRLGFVFALHFASADVMFLVGSWKARGQSMVSGITSTENTASAC